MADPKKPEDVRSTRSMFGVVSCAKQSGQTYDIRGGGKGTTIIRATVPYRGLSIECNVAAKFDGKESLTVEASVPRGISFDDESNADLFKDHVLSSASAWVGYNDAEQGGINRIKSAYGVKVEIPGDASGKTLKPRLVKHMTLAVKPSATPTAA